MSTPIPIITASGLTEPIWPTEEGAVHRILAQENVYAT